MADDKIRKDDTTTKNDETATVEGKDDTKAEGGDETEDTAGAEKPNVGDDKTFTQADVERIIADRLKRERKSIDKAADDERKRIRKEAEEKELLEGKQFEELAKRKDEELAELRAQIERREHNDKVTQLLDKKELVEPAFRKLFVDMPGDLADIADAVDGFLKVFDSVVEKCVNDRLGTKMPPKTTKETKELSPQDRLEVAEKKMRETHDATEYMRIAGEIQDRQKSA